MEYCHADIILVAFGIIDLCSGARCNGFVVDFQRQRSNGDSWREWAMDITMRLPENKNEVSKIIDYARGERSCCRVVQRYIDKIPEELWENGRRICASAY